MSQIEQDFRLLIGKKPEIEKCYSEGLINRRALARYLIKKGIAKSNQLEATIAMLRRFEFQKTQEHKDMLKNIRISMKDGILIVDIEKSREALQQLQKLISITDYDKGDTLKIVVGTAHITVYIDAKKETKLREVLGKIIKRYKNVSEISLFFPEQAIATKGILAFLTREFSLHDLNVVKLLTSSVELLFYFDDKDVLKAYDILKRLQN